MNKLVAILVTSILNQNVSFLQETSTKFRTYGIQKFDDQFSYVSNKVNNKN